MENLHIKRIYGVSVCGGSKADGKSRKQSSIRIHLLAKVHTYYIYMEKLAQHLLKRFKANKFAWIANRPQTMNIMHSKMDICSYLPHTEQIATATTTTTTTTTTTMVPIAAVVVTTIAD